MDIVTRIERLFRDHGHLPHAGDSPQPVTALEHALQCAQLAEWGGADETLIAAALLHDIGHLLLEDTADCDAAEDAHERVGADFLAGAFDPRLVQIVRLHVAAKRYLVTVEPLYALALSAASTHALAAQGGCMSRAEVAQFETLPHALDAVLLRRLDDAAEVPGRITHPLGRYLTRLDRLLEGRHATSIAAR